MQVFLNRFNEIGGSYTKKAVKMFQFYWFFEFLPIKKLSHFTIFVLHKTSCLLGVYIIHATNVQDDARRVSREVEHRDVVTSIFIPVIDILL